AVEAPADFHAASDHLATLEHAIANATPLRITYYTATRDATTTRTIEPLRLEWRRQIPYLIAYCRLRQDERVFRVSRILAIDV
ncbi:MAG: WYL domain-containing protein, partial [Chloroflexi bacterium]|nr:WYL domain-containing protein [Chloroflexota bacterium]